MILLASLAALSLGAAPVPVQNPVQIRTSPEPVKVQVVTPAVAGPIAPRVKVWKAEAKPWLAHDIVKPADKLSALAKL